MRIGSFVLLSLFLFTTGCESGDASVDGPSGSTGQVTLTQVAGEAPAKSCPNRGVTLNHGVDENGSGVLEESEIDRSYQICHGRDGRDGTDAE